MSRHVQFILIGLVCFLIGLLAAQRLPVLQAQPPGPPIPPAPAAEAAKGPKWLHGLDLKVRQGGQTDFTKETKKIGVEVFKDENTNNLIYISETGSIAVVPAK